MTPAQFRDALKVMMFLDRHELEEAGIIFVDDLLWKRFRAFPHEQSLRLTDDSFDLLFSLIKKRMKQTEGDDIDRKIVESTLRVCGFEPDDAVSSDGSTILDHTMDRVRETLRGAPHHG